MKMESDLRISLVTVIVLKKKRKDTKHSDHRKISLIARTTKMLARVLRRIERKVEDVLGENQFGLRRGEELGMQLGC
jgi:vacuolar-type H+-ATPase catalytic subunit A/Vma1